LDEERESGEMQHLTPCVVSLKGRPSGEGQRESGIRKSSTAYRCRFETNNSQLKRAEEKRRVLNEPKQQ
jgi:hypothetical protein